jgi:hypothetical protein
MGDPALLPAPPMTEPVMSAPPDAPDGEAPEGEVGVELLHAADPRAATAASIRQKRRTAPSNR